MPEKLRKIIKPTERYFVNSLRISDCCFVCKHAETEKELCKKHTCSILSYFVCDDFEVNSEHDRNNPC